MRRDIYEKMIKAPGGGVSSTRVKGWAAWKYFTWINVVFLLGFCGLVWLVVNSAGAGEVPTGVLWVYASVWILIDVLLLLYSSAPAQFAKNAEVKQIIGLAEAAMDKTGIKDPEK